MNRAAEAAAEEAVSVFADSIRKMSPSDVLAVFNGGDDAAAQYLRADYRAVARGIRTTLSGSRD